MFTIPYKWRPRTIWPNITSMAGDVRFGVRNFWRWAPIIWRDADFDWDYLAALMEEKLRQMAQDAKTWRGAGVDLYRRRMLVCAEILKRLRDGEWYWRNARKTFGDTSLAAERAMRHERADKRYLGELIGKYIDHWWD
jgi:hypothetical protein